MPSKMVPKAKVQVTQRREIEIPIEIRARKFFKKNALWLVPLVIVIVSWAAVAFLSRSRALAGWASSVGFSYVEEHDHQLLKTFKEFDFGTKGSTRYACHVMRGMLSMQGVAVNVTAFDLFYSGTEKYDDGDTYVDENEFSVVAFSMPHHDFKPLKVWPRKYLLRLRPGEPLPGDDDAAQDAAAVSEEADSAVKELTTAVKGDSGGFDEGKETYLEYKSRLRREKKARGSEEPPKPSSEDTPIPSEGSSNASEPAELISENDAEMEPEPEAKPAASIEEVEAKSQQAEANRRITARFDKTHASEAEDEVQAIAVLTQDIKSKLIARHDKGQVERSDFSYILDFVGGKLILYREAQMEPEDLSQALNFGQQIIQHLPNNLTEAVAKLEAKYSAESAAAGAEEEEEDDEDMAQYARQWLKEYLDECKATKGLESLSEDDAAELNRTLTVAYEMTEGEEELSLQDVKTKYREVEKQMDTVRGLLYEGGEDKYEDDPEEVAAAVDADVSRELAEDADDDM